MKDTIAVIGLGYVGLPLVIEFGKKFKTIGYDIDKKRINDLISKKDITGELSSYDLGANSNIMYTSNLEEIKCANIYIIAVPTPIDKNNKPDLNILLNATKDVGNVIDINDIVIFESTVYPGCTEEECVPILEKKSHLIYNKDFFCGYSPERINPGDKKRTLTKIVKITSGSNKKTLLKIDSLYNTILEKGTFPVSSIKVAEAAKIIENCQRDINIAFVNELSILFNLLNIDTKEVLEAAGTKWNFLPFTPGLVGGHCIGVDPYYLTYKAEQLGYDSKIILSGRKLNDSMPQHVFDRIEKIFSTKKIKMSKAKILLLGITFKENCTDTRNSKIVDLYNIFIKENAKVDVYDPLAIKEDVQRHFNIELLNFNDISKIKYDCVIIGVPHDCFLNINIKQFLKDESVVFDIKGIFKEKYERL
tara:strand:- start:558 stop:1814 length:1257 start_codon:yes stop_codon:yes gene_type:complete